MSGSRGGSRGSVLEGPPDGFPKCLHRFTFPPAGPKRADPSTSSPTLVPLPYQSHARGCEVTSHCGFHANVLRDEGCSLFSCACWLLPRALVPPSELGQATWPSFPSGNPARLTAVSRALSVVCPSPACRPLSPRLALRPRTALGLPSQESRRDSTVLPAPPANTPFALSRSRESRSCPPDAPSCEPA